MAEPQKKAGKLDRPAPDQDHQEAGYNEIYPLSDPDQALAGRGDQKRTEIGGEINVSLQKLYLSQLLVARFLVLVSWFLYDLHSTPFFAYTAQFFYYMITVR